MGDEGREAGEQVWGSQMAGVIPVELMGSVEGRAETEAGSKAQTGV